MRSKRKKGGLAILAVALLAIGIMAAPGPQAPVGSDTSRLVSVQHLPEGEVCTWDDSSQADPDLMALLQQEGGSSPLVASLQQAATARPAAPAPAGRVLTPVRVIRDQDPGYSAIAVDLLTNEVVLQDNNLWSYRVFNRTDNTPPGAKFTEPKRVVQGDKTELQFNNGLYIDPKTSEIYSVESDTGDKMVVFPNNADGNVAPKRMLHSPHRVYNIAADESKSELYVTVEFPPEVIVYNKTAFGEEQPLRRIRGDKTGLDAPHGIAVDEKNRLLFVNTWGHASNYKIKGTGAFYPPSIKVYSLDAKDDTPPLRVITGDKTQLNWPAAMKFNPDNGDLYVANDIGQSVLVFSGASSAQGNVVPARALKGSKTRLAYPTGVALDKKNQELWVSNLGNSSATVYPLMATGDVPPLRIIRSAPVNKKSLNFGRTAAVAYDSKREQILVPN
jgi:6-phosphogluconolactonase (cycloisomerase 2 family)